MDSKPVVTSHRLFPVLALATALLTIGLIAFGAVVRVTESGLGCGEHWPLCNGTIFPPLDNLTAWIEWLHRLFAALIGVLGIAMLVVAWRVYRKQNRLVLYATVAAALLFFLQSALGAFAVILSLPSTTVALHLGTAMLLLAALLLAGVAARYHPETSYRPDHVTRLVYLNTGMAFAIIVTGALVRGTGASLACTGWPLCNGALLPFDQGQLAIVHMVHRYAVLGLGATLLMLAWHAFQERNTRYTRLLTGLALAAYLAQAAIGAAFVFSAAAPAWAGAHVAFAAITWALLVVLGAIEALNTAALSGEPMDTQWQANSEPTSN